MGVINMLSIGQFSQASKLSVKTLRYYHDLEILIPEKIDQASGYRYYTEASLIRAEEIARWKEMGFSLSEIQDLLPLQQQQMWEELKRRIKIKAEQLDRKEQEIRQKRDRLLQWEPSSHLSGRLEGDVILKTEEVLSYLYVPVTGPYNHIGKGFARIYSDPSASITGPPFSLYYQLGFEETPEMLACAPGHSSSLTSNIRSARLDEGQWACQLYRGPYDELGHAYQALFDFCSLQGLSATVPAREIYLQGPDQCTPEQYLTEVRLRVEKN